MAGKSKADAQGDWYKLEANKQTLLTLLRLRFPPLPPEIEQRIVRTLDARQVKTWLCRFAHGDDLDSLGILSAEVRDKARLKVKIERTRVTRAERDRYVLEANKRTLTMLLELRYYPLPPMIKRAIVRTQDAGEVARWLRRFSTARDLDSLGILSPSQMDRARWGDVRLAFRTIAQVEGERYSRIATLAERKRTLLEQLRLRFGTLALEIEHTIDMSQDTDRLAEWLRGVITAKDLDGIGILSIAERDKVLLDMRILDTAGLAT